ncbi:hypothetical protein DUNSADRAFT_16538 [Dunaliella salina]|uniref:GDSL esterase/lipase n=1 Tax=Dunaliella salina TaxID=3046 RepID=A0ABQ7G3B9_DUNSA|nr:hypothetical protein DUNSADRAFT_16538 [Dunaliella salina]|eukprot:KAF5829101.1 hypothetical protein DUNSADRAFT_16538 [Dunaliella salina]
MGFCALTLYALALLATSSRAAVSDLNVLVLGDSISDQGNLYAATSGAVPGEDYYQGRASNGPIWCGDL